MKASKKVIYLLVALMALSSLWASGVGENKKDFASLDLKTESIETIKTSYSNALGEYNEQKTKLVNSMDEAYKKKDVKEYLTLRDLYSSLYKPTIDEEKTELLVERILNSTDENEKKEISDFLYEESSYYNPTLTFVVEDGNRYFTKTVMVEPGETIVSPEYSSSTATLKGWGITKDEVTYSSNDEIVMPYTSTVLYGILTNAITFEDDVTGYYYTTEDNTTTVVNPQSPSEEYIFLGWYNNGKKLEDDTVEREDGENLIYKAYWKALSVDSYSVKYYETTSVPQNEQVKLTLDITNEGNTSLNGLTLKLEENENVKVLSPSLKARRVNANRTVEASFVIVLTGTSGETVETNLVATDSEGNSWTTPISFTIK